MKTKKINDLTILDNIPDMLFNSVPQEHCKISSKKFPTPHRPQESNLKNILTRLLEYIRQILWEMFFFNPTKCFLFTETKQLKIPGIAKIPQAEFIMFT